ncbi:hypothetical protein CMZ84_04210 [Lysobacteraceae bacterium NML93-0399]|nr:hypothetical protein CMZ84_04210 [Xanthomonadaceae bacterium NML93-0399]
MGLIARTRHARYVYGWRLRYWWMDTRSGDRARVIGFCLAVMVAIIQFIQMALVAMFPTPGAPAKAYWWIVQLVIMIVAVAVAYAMRPKPQNAQERKVDPPTVEDGTAVKDYFGTCWIEHEDNFLLAWKVVGQDPIRR